MDDFYLEDPTEMSMVDNPALDFSDLYDAFTAVLLACYTKALQDEYYEVLILIEKVYSLQRAIMSVYIRHSFEGEEKEAYEEWLETADDYYQQIKLQAIKNKTK